MQRAYIALGNALPGLWSLEKRSGTNQRGSIKETTPAATGNHEKDRTHVMTARRHMSMDHLHATAPIAALEKVTW
jgi:hypothetical protein